MGRLGDWPRHKAESKDMGGVELLVGQFAASEGVREVEAIDECSRVHPAISGDVVAGGRERVVEGHAHCLEGFDEGAGVDRVGVGGAEGGGYELYRCFDLVAEVFF